MRINLLTVIRFLRHAQELEWSFNFILDQLELVNSCAHASRLHDSTLILLDD